MLHINVANVIFGDPQCGDTLPELSFSLPVNTISLSDLIARSVENQINNLLDEQQRSNAQAQAMLAQQFLGESQVNEQVPTGKVALSRPPKKETDVRIDTDREVRRAINAFKENKYKVFINGREYCDLSEVLAFEDAVKVKFLRVMPLAGG